MEQETQGSQRSYSSFLGKGSHIVKAFSVIAHKINRRLAVTGRNKLHYDKLCNLYSSKPIMKVIK